MLIEMIVDPEDKNRDYINPADSRPVYRPIKCQILALFSSADKNKII